MIVKTFDVKVEDFITSLDKPTYAKASRTIILLRTFGNELRMPYSKSLGGNLFELRARGQREIRIFYTFHAGEAILLHAFIKKTQNTPLREIESARAKLKGNPTLMSQAITSLADIHREN